MTVPEKFKKIRQYLGLSQPEMSEKIGLSRNAWQTYELGKSAPGTAVYQSLISLGFSADWILSDSGDMMLAGECTLSGYSFLPLYDCNADAGAGCVAEDVSIVDWLAFSNDWIRMELRVPTTNLGTLVAEGDSMLPTVTPGDILVVDHARKQLCGDGIYVLNLFGNCLVKRLQVLFDGSVKIISDNPAYKEQIVRGDDLQALSVAGRVVWHGKRV